MEGEMNTFAVVWITVFASLCYCQTIAKFIPKGITRFLAFFPISVLFTLLPLRFTTVHLGGISCFFIAGLANCRILAFAFGKGSLSRTPSLPLSVFIPLACLPIKIRDRSSKESEETSSQQRPRNQKQKTSLLNYFVKICLFGLLKKMFEYRENFHPNFFLLLCCLHLYFTLELLLAMIAALTRILMHVELEPQFNEPYLSTSLQDFWGRRWNIMVSDTLKPTVFEPTRSIFTGLVGRKRATFLGVLATFLVSGLLHELFFYTYGRQKTRWEVTCFFLLHGVCLSIEMVLKKTVEGKFRLPTMVSRLLTVIFVVLTSSWLFFTPFLRRNGEVKVCKEYHAFVEFVQSGRLLWAVTRIGVAAAAALLNASSPDALRVSRLCDAWRSVYGTVLLRVSASRNVIAMVATPRSLIARSAWQNANVVAPCNTLNSYL
ncbi:acyl-CoA--sterol O-acyltransferase 1-like [Apium graveolens]|uniref:acyl-CoA--sterol O-acyltransferase 1-like n=1 Tax=Apium graveolens TaxID=4045 RepID=UPI003D78CF05